MVTKMADNIGLKQKLPFWTKFKAFGDRFFKNKIYGQLNTGKSF